MSYINLDSQLITSDKFVKTMALLKVGPRDLLWNLVHFWIWISTKHPDGNLKDVSDTVIALQSQWNGEPKAFVDALIVGGFIDRNHGCLVVHDWEEWKPKFLKDSTTRRRRVTDASTTRSVQSSNPLEDVVHVFQTTGKQQTWELTTKHMRQWEGIFPGVNLVLEVRKAVAWWEANPTRRKTARGMDNFFLRWMERAQNSSRGFGKTDAQRQQDRESERERVKLKHQEYKEHVKRIMAGDR